MLIVTNGVYRLHDEDVNKRVPGSAIKGRKVSEANAVTSADKDKLLTGNGAQVNTSGVCLPVIANSDLPDNQLDPDIELFNFAIDRELATLKAKIEQKPIEIKNLELKLDVLKKLEPLLSGDIGAVLLDVVDDLQAIQGAA